MNRAEKKETRIKIGNLLENKCGPCPYKQTKGSTPYNCLECPVYVELNDLGNKLLNVKISDTQKKEYNKIPHGKFVELFEQGRTNEEIEVILRTRTKVVVSHREKYEKGISKKYIALPHQAYIEYFEQGLTAKEVMELTGCSENAYYVHKRKWRENNILKGVWK